MLGWASDSFCCQSDGMVSGCVDKSVEESEAHGYYCCCDFRRFRAETFVGEEGGEGCGRVSVWYEFSVGQACKRCVFLDCFRCLRDVVGGMESDPAPMHVWIDVALGDECLMA